MRASRPAKRQSSEQCKASILARFHALQVALEHPDQIPVEFVNATSSITSFLELEIMGLGISRIGSRNTAIKYANLELSHIASERGSNGWDLLDRLRKMIYEKHLPNSGRRSVAAKNNRLTEKIENIQLKLDQTERLMLSQSRAYVWLLSELRGLASSQNIDENARRRISLLLKSNSETFAHLFESDNITHARGGTIVDIT